MNEIKGKLASLGKFKYPLIVLLLGLLIVLFPTGSLKSGGTPEGAEGLSQVLSCTEGVGEARVILSDKGVVVVCPGADSPRVRFDIIQAVSSYTGFGSDRITVLKMGD